VILLILPPALREVQSGITNGPIFQLFPLTGDTLKFEPVEVKLAWRIEPWVSQSK